MSYETSASSGSTNTYGSKYSPYQDQTDYEKIYKKTTAESRIQEGEKLAREAWEYGVVGIFTVGILFGPWAIMKSLKAKKKRVNATAGFVTGIIAIIVNVCILGYVGFLFSVVA